MRKKLLLFALMVAATTAASFSAPWKTELTCDRRCCGANVCTCCHTGCLCPR